MALCLGKSSKCYGPRLVPTYSPHSNVREAEDKFKVFSSFLFVPIKFRGRILYSSVTALWKEADNLLEVTAH